jgi:hypothetical protein
MTLETGPLGLEAAYLSRREAEERLAAERSVDPAARLVHVALADGYAARLRTMLPAAA